VSPAGLLGNSLEGGLADLVADREAWTWRACPRGAKLVMYKGCVGLSTAPSADATL
jgi:hypothetical protein